MRVVTFFACILSVLSAPVDIFCYALKRSAPPQSFKLRKERRAPSAPGVERKRAARPGRSVERDTKASQKITRTSLRDISRHIELTIDTATQKESAVWKNKFDQQMPLIIKEGTAASGGGDFYIGSFYSSDTGKNYSAYIRK